MKMEYEEKKDNKKIVLEWLYDRKQFLITQNIKEDEFYNTALFCINYLIDVLERKNQFIKKENKKCKEKK